MQGIAPVRPWLGSLLAIALLSLGCQTYQSGMTLPSDHYLEHPPQYFPPTPDSKPQPLPEAAPTDPPQPRAVAEVPAEQPQPIPAAPPEPPLPPLPSDPTLPPPVGRPPQPARGQLKPARYAPSPSIPHKRAEKGTESALVRITDLEDFVLKTERMTFNNIAITRSESTVGSAGQFLVGIKACYRNRTNKPAVITLVLVGLDNNEEVLWACQVSGRAEPEDVGCLPDTQMMLFPSAIKDLTSIRVRAYVAEDTSNQGLSPATSYSLPSTIAPSRTR